MRKSNSSLHIHVQSIHFVIYDITMYEINDIFEEMCTMFATRF